MAKNWTGTLIGVGAAAAAYLYLQRRYDLLDYLKIAAIDTIEYPVTPNQASQAVQSLNTIAARAALQQRQGLFTAAEKTISTLVQRYPSVSNQVVPISYPTPSQLITVGAVTPSTVPTTSTRTTATVTTTPQVEAALNSAITYARFALDASRSNPTGAKTDLIKARRAFAKAKRLGASTAQLTTAAGLISRANVALGGGTR